MGKKYDFLADFVTYLIVLQDLFLSMWLLTTGLLHYTDRR